MAHEDLPTEELLDNALTAAHSEPGSELYWNYVHPLRRRSGTDVFQRATALCSDSDPVARELGADILSQLGARMNLVEFPFADESAPILLSLLDDTNLRVVISAISALGFLNRGDSSVLARLSTHSNEEVRHAVACALAGRTDGVAINTLIALSDDADFDTRNWATFALGSQCDTDTPAIRDALAKRLTEDDAEIRGEAILGLALRQDSRALEPLRRELEEDDVMFLAIEAVEAMPRAEFLPKLENMHASDPDQVLIARALARCREISDRS